MNMTKTTTKTRTPVFFIATRAKEGPISVSFYTKKGEEVASDAVKKIKTKKGVYLYVETEVKKR